MAGKHSWEEVPETIREFYEEETADVVVIGAGIAGVTAAQSAAEAGASVIVAEKCAKWCAHGMDIGSVNTTAQKKVGISIDPAEAARLAYAWSQQQANYRLIRTYTEKSGEVLSHYIELAEKKGYKVRINTDLTARADWANLEEKYRMFPTAHLFELPEGSPLKKEYFPVAYFVRMVYESAQEYGAKFYFKTKAEQLIKEDGRITGVVVSDEKGYKKLLAKKGVILATGGISENDEMKQCFCPLTLRVDKNDYFPKGGNAGEGHIMAAWAGAAFSRCYPAPIIHPVNFTVLGPGINSSWMTVDKNGERFCNEMAYEPIVTNARMNAPGNIAWAIWDGNYMENYKHQEPNKFKALPENAEELVEKCVEKGDYIRRDTLKELAEAIGVPAKNLETTVKRYNRFVKAGKDEDFGVPERFLSPILEGPFYASKISAYLLAIPYGMRVDNYSRILDEQDEPIPGLYAVGNMQGDFFANSYPVTMPGSSHGRSICFGRLVGQAVAEDRLADIWEPEE